MLIAAARQCDQVRGAALCRPLFDSLAPPPPSLWPPHKLKINPASLREAERLKLTPMLLACHISTGAFIHAHATHICWDLHKIDPARDVIKNENCCLY